MVVKLTLFERDSERVNTHTHTKSSLDSYILSRARITYIVINISSDDPKTCEPYLYLNAYGSVVV